MANAALMGWDADAKVWRKVVVNAAGKLIIDPSEIFENVPTLNEHGKAPDSDWAVDHAANASAHHTRYTDAESRAAIGNLLDSTGKVLKNPDANYKVIINLDRFRLQKSAVSTKYANIASGLNTANLEMDGYEIGVGYCAAHFFIYDGSAYRLVATEIIVDNKIATHRAIASAHHTRYTDDEARAAVGYNGTKQWSCAGINFDAVNPATHSIEKSTSGYIKILADNIEITASVLLPDGAVVTRVLVGGNAAAAAETWALSRIKISDKTVDNMASANINSEDTTITEATINNAMYSYFFHTTSLDTNDEVWGASITYTI